MPRPSVAQALSALGAQPERVLILDVETSAHLAWTFDLWDARIAPSQIVERSRMLCFAAKWRGDRKVLFASEFHDGREAMLDLVWRLLDEAEVLVTYNGPKFDVPVMQRELVLAGYPPPSPWIDVDLLRIVRRRFRFASNRLGEVAQELGLGGKVETSAGLWPRCMAGDEKAWRLMRKYNIGDVRLTEELLDRLGPWSTTPHAGLWSGNRACCWSCGGVDLVFAGSTIHTGKRWPRLRCESCGATSRVAADGATVRA